MSAVLSPRRVHASARPRTAPLLQPEQDAVSAEARLAFTGVLHARPHVANRVIDSEGHVLPVLVLDLDDVGPGHHRLHVEVPYTERTRAEAESTARALRKGQAFTVYTALTDIRLYLPAASLSHHDDHQP